MCNLSVYLRRIVVKYSNILFKPALPTEPSQSWLTRFIRGDQLPVVDGVTLTAASVTTDKSNLTFQIKLNVLVNRSREELIYV
jgi:hypothetical protein